MLSHCEISKVLEGSVEDFEHTFRKSATLRCRVAEFRGIEVFLCVCSSFVNLVHEDTHARVGDEIHLPINGVTLFH